MEKDDLVVSEGKVNSKNVFSACFGFTPNFPKSKRITGKITFLISFTDTKIKRASASIAPIGPSIIKIPNQNGLKLSEETRGILAKKLYIPSFHSIGTTGSGKSNDKRYIFHKGKL